MGLLRILRISCRDRSRPVARATNVEALNKLKKTVELMNIINRRVMSYFGHVARNNKYTLLQHIITGKVGGKQSVGKIPG